jgi:hypothetical protein
VNNRSRQREAVNARLRKVWDNVFTWLSKLFNLEKFEDYRNTPEYKKELELYKKFDAIPGVEYSPLIAYAKALLERCDALEDSLEQKADSIIKYLGGGTTLVALSAFLSIKPDNARVCLIASIALLAFIPALAFAVQALRYAIASLRPQNAATLQGLEHTKKIADFYRTEKEVEFQLWLLLYPMCVANLYRNKVKADYVKSAHDNYLRAIIGLILPALAIAISLLVTYFAGDFSSAPQGPIPVKIVK